MAKTKPKQWATKPVRVSSIDLDRLNPRLSTSSASSSPAELIQEMFEHENAYEIAESISKRGYFPNEPLLVIREDGRYIAVEGNRRLAALKGLSDPDLVGEKFRKQVSKLARNISSDITAEVPVTIAPGRRATDKQVAGRHVGTPVKPWRTENRARFILEKIEEGYDTDSLSEELGFSPSAVMAARQTKAIRDMVRALDLPEDAKSKFENPRSKNFNVVERIFESKIGKEFLKVEADVENGFRIKTTIPEFKKGLTRIALDAAKKDGITSRKLNKVEQIRAYLESWNNADRPQSKKGSFVPADLVRPGTATAPAQKSAPKPSPKAVKINRFVLPRTLKAVFGSDRIKLILSELYKLDRAEFSNAGAVLLRVFLELCALDYLRRSGEYETLIKDLETKGVRLRFGVPEMSHLAEWLKVAAEKNISDRQQLRGVKRALTKNESAPFNISDLHSFVHHGASLPTEKDILQFWLLSEPLFRMMLEQE